MLKDHAVKLQDMPETLKISVLLYCLLWRDTPDPPQQKMCGWTMIDISWLRWVEGILLYTAIATDDVKIKLSEPMVACVWNN